MPQAFFGVCAFVRWGVTVDDIRREAPSSVNDSWLLSETLRDRLAVLLEAHRLDPDRAVTVNTRADCEGFELSQ